MKRCTTCAEMLPSERFYRDENRLDGLYPACRACHNKRTKAWKNANRERARELDRIRYHEKGGAQRKRAEKLLARYGLTVAAYQALLEVQGGVCAVCLLPFVDVLGSGRGKGAGGGNWDTASVDHCHETGRVRGILHRRCNLALELGLTEDDWRRAREYLAANEEAAHGTPKQ